MILTAAWIWSCAGLGSPEVLAGDSSAPGSGGDVPVAKHETLVLAALAHAFAIISPLAHDAVLGAAGLDVSGVSLCRNEKCHFYIIHSSKNILWNIYEGEILVITLPTTPHQIFCNIILNLYVIVKRIRYPDENDMSNTLPTGS